MYARTLTYTARKINGSFKVLMITGPRQVGKTTLLRDLVDGERNYVTLDDLNARTVAQQDPGLFIQQYQPPVTIDEVQYAPNIFSSIKIAVDRAQQNGMYWLTGSQKYHLMKGITESLAGRVAIVDLLGLSLAELEGRAEHSIPFMPTPEWLAHAEKYAKRPKGLKEIYQQIWRGSFPEVNLPGVDRNIFYRSYVQTYVQRDVQDILKITDATQFNNFLIAVAARTGQLLNYSDLARDVGIDNKTAKAWLSVLETSGLVYLLHPYFNNVGKRMVKAPKLYFLDTGLCTYLTQWPDAAALESSAMAGAILETFIFTEILKSYWHNGVMPRFYYYRDVDQQEVDLLIDTADTIYPVEFKKTATPSLTASKHFKALEKFGKKIGHGMVICFVEKPVMLSREVTAIPVGIL
mgnify:CR=1 FL=1